MADPHTDAPVTTLDPAKDLPAPVVANADASAKGAAEVYNLPPGAKPADVTQVTDSTLAAGDGHEHTGISDAAAQAYEKGASTLHPGAAKAELVKPVEPPALDFDNSPFTSHPKADGHKGAAVEVKDHTVKVSNDVVAASRSAAGVDTVHEKGSGENFTRDARGIHEQAADRTTTIASSHVVDKFASVEVSRSLKAPLAADATPAKPGQIKQGSDAVSYADPTGAGSAEGHSNDTIAMKQSNGDQLVLNSKTNTVAYTESGGQAQTMTLDQYKAAHGSKFANFNLDSTAQVTNVSDGAVVQAHDGKAIVAKTDPTNKDVVQATVKADGTSELTHVDSKGTVLSDSKIDYNNPAQAYQQLDAQGKVVASYDANANTFNGNGFAFTNSGMQINGGDVFVGDNGSYTANASYDSINSDGSVSYYTGDGSVYGSLAFNDSQGTGLSQDVQADVASQLASISGDLTGNVDELENLQMLTGGKLNLSGLIEKAEAREQRTALQHDPATGNLVLDLGAGQDPYKTAA